ncbi:Bug family tripartite tricarboxylate transporter substrate binding protein [Chloroflexota bacterium]
MKRFLVLIVTIVLVSAFILTGCAKPEPAPAPAPAPKPAPAPAPKPAPKPSPAPAPKPAAVPYYQGKVITIYCCSGAGGDTDLFARTMGASIARHFPGTPRVIVENRSGAGGALGMKYYVERSRPDGLNFVTTSTGVPRRWLAGAEGHTYDFAKVQPMLNVPVSATLITGGASGISNMHDLIELSKERTITIGTDVAVPGTGGLWWLNAIFPLLGVENVKLVAGYPTGASVHYALLQGEVDLDHAVTSAWMTMYKGLVETGDIVPLMQMGRVGATGELARHKIIIPDVPTVFEIYQDVHGKPIPDKENGAITAWAKGDMGKCLYTHADAPAEAKQAMAAGFKSMFDSPEFREVSRTSFGGEPEDVLLVGTSC